MKKTTLIILFTLIAGFVFSQSQIDYMQPQFKGDVDVADTLKVAQYIDSTYVEYYSGANDAAKITAALSAVDRVIFSRAYTLNASLSPGADKTLIFLPGASIGSSSGIFTGNNTTIINPDNHAILDSRMTYAGTFNGDAKPEWFGADGTDTSDDYAALQDMITAFMANNNLTFPANKKYYISSGLSSSTDFNLIMNNSEIYLSSTSASPITMLTITGTAGTQYDLDSIAGAGQDYIVCSNSTLLSSLDAGDMVFITSSSYFDIGEPTFNQGEYQIVKEISGSKIILNGSLYDTYLTDSTAGIKRISPLNVNIINGKFTSNSARSCYTVEDTLTTGIRITYAYNCLIANCSFLNCNYTGVSITGSYNPILENNNVDWTYADGIGYGFEFIGCTDPKTFYNKFSHTRHAIAHTGDLENGINHNYYHYGNYAAGIRGTHIYDVHIGSGKGKFENCTAVGGIVLGENESVNSNYKEYWQTGITYTSGQIVSYQGAYFNCDVASTTANPGTSSDWSYYNNFQSGFVPRTKNITVKNCTTINCGYGVRANSYTSDNDNFTVDGLTVINGTYAIGSSGGTVFTNASFDNIVLDNEYYKTEPYLFRVIDSVEFNNCFFGTFTADKARGLYLDTKTESYLKFDKIKSYDFAIYSGNSKEQGDCHLSIDNLEYTGYSSGAYGMTFIKGINELMINKIVADSVTGGLLTFISTDNSNVNKCYLGTIELTGKAALARVFNITDTILDFAVISCNMNTIDANDPFGNINGDGRVVDAYIGYLGGNYGSVWAATTPENEIYPFQSSLTSNIILGSYYLSGDGGNEGLQIEADGDGVFSKNAYIEGNYLYFGNDEYIDNATNGRITFNGDTRSTGDFYLGASKNIVGANGENFNNTTDNYWTSDKHLQLGSNSSLDPILKFLATNSGTITWMEDEKTFYFDAAIKVVAQSAAPSTASGTIYFDTDDNHFYGWNGSTWVQLDN